MFSYISSFIDSFTAGFEPPESFTASEPQAASVQSVPAVKRVDIDLVDFFAEIVIDSDKVGLKTAISNIMYKLGLGGTIFRIPILHQTQILTHGQHAVVLELVKQIKAYSGKLGIVVKPMEEAMASIGLEQVVKILKTDNTKIIPRKDSSGEVEHVVTLNDVMDVASTISSPTQMMIRRLGYSSAEEVALDIMKHSTGIGRREADEIKPEKRVFIRPSNCDEFDAAEADSWGFVEEFYGPGKRVKEVKLQTKIGLAKANNPALVRDDDHLIIFFY